MVKGTAPVDAEERDRWNEWTVGDLHDTLVDTIKAGFRRTIFVWGQRGVGKSAIVQQAAMMSNAVVIDRRLSMMDPADIRGVLMAGDAAGGLARWMLNPDFFPKLEKDQRLVIFLDEFNHAPDMIQKAAYEVAWDHTIGGVKFPEGTVIILAGNRETENANVTPLDKPMRRRVIHCYVHYDFASYWKYAETRFHPLVTSYHKKHPDKVNQPVDNDQVEYFGEPLPATWEVVSDILRTYPDSPRRLKMIAGTLGPGAAQEFEAWCRTESVLEPIIDAVLAGEDKTAEAIDQQFFVCQSVAERFRHDKTIATRILEYADAIKSDYAEVAGVMLTTARNIDHDALRRDEKVFRRVMKNYYKVLV